MPSICLTPQRVPDESPLGLELAAPVMPPELELRPPGYRRSALSPKATATTAPGVGGRWRAHLNATGRARRRRTGGCGIAAFIAAIDSYALRKCGQRRRTTRPSIEIISATMFQRPGAGGGSESFDRSGKSRIMASPSMSRPSEGKSGSSARSGSSLPSPLPTGKDRLTFPPGSMAGHRRQWLPPRPWSQRSTRK